ncbi:MAG: hypothetical protein LBH29_06740, partial [Elusimicrobiota bacterium]|nr:hypothetical protein [Elusimicrobiota bacterium]
MRKLLSVVFVLALAFSAANAQLGDGVKIYGDGQIYLYGGYQDASNPQGFSFSKESQFEFVGNLFVSKKFEATGGTGVLHLRGSSRDIKNDTGTIWDIGNIRGTINDSFDPNIGQSAIYIKELYYTQPVADNFVVFTVGKIAYLGNTQGYGAIGSAFNDDAVLATSLYS